MMKKKVIIILILAILMFSGCVEESTHVEEDITKYEELKTEMQQKP